MFPGAGAQIYRNEAGEVTGFDGPDHDDEPYDPDDYLVGDDEGDEPQEPDDAEVSWQEYGRAEHEADSYHDEAACADQHGDCACG